MAITNTVSFLELVWTMTAFIGMLIAVMFSYDAYRDRLVLYAAGEEDTARQELARGHQINAAAKATALALHTMIGIVAMTQTNRSSLVGTTIAGCFLFAEFCLVYALVRNHRARKKVLVDETALINERLRLATAAVAVSNDLAANTAALAANTAATQQATEALYNGTTRKE